MSAILEVWGQGRLLRELHVPSKQHGSLYNDGWFSLGPAWSPDETRIAYVAEVTLTPPPPPPSALVTGGTCAANELEVQASVSNVKWHKQQQFT